MADQQQRRITDAATLKAFGHPLRMRLYRGLFIARRATASHLADQVDEAVSLVSYHLRKLAEHGLIEEAESPGSDGRERWWQVASDGVAWAAEDFGGGPEEAAVYRTVGRLIAEQRHEQYLAYRETESAWSPEWRTASLSSEYLAPLTPAELTAFGRELHELAMKYQNAGRAAEEAGDTAGRETVSLHLYGFPFRP
ncbi:helix-turn-helix domain-containing protein [Streptomyces sp. NPDC093085]|uniref:ArsR/SmtB family transcription factor n=1 Tax=Streptomyces sp. NPDC093085 TaxID=3155068 RepID=UPI00344A8E80